MKAITLWQPWATLIAIGAKCYETRSWETNHRGPIAIHAAKRPVRFAECNADIREALHQQGHTDLVSLPYGCVVCVADLTECYAVEAAQFLGLLSNLEERFGDYSPGRFAWRLENVWQIDNIPAQGGQGIWHWQPPGEFKYD